MIKKTRTKKTDAKKVEKRKRIVFIIMLKKKYTKATCGKKKN